MCEEHRVSKEFTQETPRSDQRPYLVRQTKKDTPLSSNKDNRFRISPSQHVHYPYFSTPYIFASFIWRY